jgi:hypothetical protein
VRRMMRIVGIATRAVANRKPWRIGGGRIVTAEGGGRVLPRLFSKDWRLGS